MSLGLRVRALNDRPLRLEGAYVLYWMTTFRRARANLADYTASRRQVAELEPQVEALDSSMASFMRQFEAGRKSWL